MAKIKNYVVGAHRRIKSTQWAWKDTAAEGDIYKTYGEMYQLSRASLREFLDGDWEEVIFNEEIEAIAFAMKMNWHGIYDLWHSEPCNILAIGPDVQMIEPTKIFGQFEEMRMFNWTDPKTYNEANPWNVTLPNYFNGDMKYYPHTMSEETWQRGLEMAKTWPEDHTPATWGNEQVIDNVMFWGQPGMTFEKAHRPDLFYQAQWLPWKPIEEQDAWNDFKMENAKVIHWHSSRHSPTKLECMRNINRMYEIEPYAGKLSLD